MRLYKCPKCGRDDGLGVSGMVYVSAEIDADGNVKSDISQDIGSADMEWHSDSSMYCNHCDYDGMVMDFN